MTPLPGIKKVEIHIIIGCSDSRDLSSAFCQARENLTLEEFDKGTLVEIHRESVAGTFITPDIIDAIRITIIDRIRKHHVHVAVGVPIEIYVHIVSHGNVKLKGSAPTRNSAIRGTLHDIEAVSGCPTNCGMMHAEDVAEELERLLLEEGPVLKLCSVDNQHVEICIRSQEDIKELLHQVHGVRTLISAGWVKSIVDLKHHPYEQKLLLREAFDRDSILRPLHIHITAGVQNYSDHTYYRVDGNVHLRNTFLERVYQKMKREGVSDAKALVAKQQPTIGLFHHSGILNARATAVALHSGSAFQAGQVFAIGGGLIADFERPYDAYKVIGFYYGIKHLGLREWILLGRTPQEARMMLTRIQRDPLMSYLVQHFGINLMLHSSPGLGKESNVPLATVICRNTCESQDESQDTQGLRKGQPAQVTEYFA